jgi:hypothetical protein
MNHLINKSQPPNEIPLKRWVYEEAEREGVKPTAIYNRMNRGKLKPLLHKINKMVIFVVCNEDYSI